MQSKIFLALYYFFLVLEGVLFLYLISTWFPRTGIQRLLFELLQPVFTFVHFLLRHSIFKSVLGDFTPILALLLFAYLQTFFYRLSTY
jgi:uncharacterized protein YggT (Ycf19 family)